MLTLWGSRIHTCLFLHQIIKNVSDDSLDISHRNFYNRRSLRTYWTLLYDIQFSIIIWLCVSVRKLNVDESQEMARICGTLQFPSTQTPFITPNFIEHLRTRVAKYPWAVSISLNVFTYPFSLILIHSLIRVRISWEELSSVLIMF